MHQTNYLDVYIYEKWNANLLPPFEVGQSFVPDVLEIKEGQTSSPSLLTEADLVSLMDKNGIGALLRFATLILILTCHATGTDATIAEHIAKIIERQYVMKQHEGRTEYLVPSTLGIGLVEGYNAIGFERSLSKPYLRKLVRQLPLHLLSIAELTLEVPDRASHDSSLRRRQDEARGD